MAKGFSKDFLWGAASAATQIEGAYNEDGKGLSIWDVAAPKRIKNGENCHVACDHYHRYKEDVALMKEMGLKSYRFSVSWPRVIPEKGKVNQLGLQFYVNLVEELKNAGIEPLCTIFHWDLPLWVMKEGGWKSAKVSNYFADYTKVVVDALSDKVTYWMTLNEPQCFIMNGYMGGGHAPFRKDYLSIPKLTRNALYSHGKAVQIIRTYAKLPPKVGIAMASGSHIPFKETQEEIQEAKKNTFFKGLGLIGNRWWLDPVVLGENPTYMGMHLDKKDMEIICQPIDFIGINVYQPFNQEKDENGKALVGIPRTSMDWTIDGRVLYWTIRFMYERYQLPIMVAENGMAENDFVMLDGKVHDPSRIDFIHRYLKGVKRAVEEDIPVLGYQYWSVMDNFEWSEGYNPRFGLIYVDYQTQQRIIKDSGYDYAEIIRTNGENL